MCAAKTISLARSTTSSAYEAKDLSTIGKASIPFSKLKTENFDTLIRSMGNANIVMIGEASHGTEDFYRVRADITRRLITDHKFQFVALEADWPDIYRVNRWVQCTGKDKSAEEALGDFDRFPRWMWRNHCMIDFAKWLRAHNETVEDKRRRVGIYGLDLYSMFTSSERVIQYLEKVDPAAADEARERYGTLSRFEDDPHEYSMAVKVGLVESQRAEVVKVLVDLLKQRSEYVNTNGLIDGDEFFCSEINAKVVRDAEEYYRRAMDGGAVTWNLRDQHMFNTLKDLLRRHEERAASKDVAQTASMSSSSSNTPPAEYKGASVMGITTQDPTPVKCVIWAHNTHIHDARASEMSAQRELNIGQLVRQHMGLDRSFAVGFATYCGTVSASTRWGGARQTMNVNPSLPGSYEHLLHEVTRKYLPMNEKDPNKEASTSDGICLLLRSNTKDMTADPDAVEMLMTARLQRAIGVQYIRHRERQSHYHYAILPKQFDYVIHIDRTEYLKAMDPDEKPGPTST